MNDNPDFLARQGPRAFGTRLRRLFETLNQGVTAAYDEAGVVFEPRWFGLMALVRSHGEIEMSQAVAELGQSHVAVVQVANALEGQGLIRRAASATDARKRVLAITPAGRSLCTRLEPLWEAVRDATADLLEDTAPNFLADLDALDAALAAQPLLERIRARLGPDAPAMSPQQKTPLRSLS